MQLISGRGPSGGLPTSRSAPEVLSCIRVVLALAAVHAVGKQDRRSGGEDMIVLYSSL